MKVEVYKAYNPDIIRKITLNKWSRRLFERVDSILRYLGELEPKITAKYIQTLTKRLMDVVKDFRIDTGLLDHEEITRDLNHLNAHPSLKDAILLYVSKHLGLTEALPSGSKEIGIRIWNIIMAGERLSYHTVKTLADILEHEKAISLWKRIVGKRLEAEQVRMEEEQREREEKGEEIPRRPELRKNAIKNWSAIGLGDFIEGVFDENSEVFRFDRCIIHEVLKDLEDPDWAYLATCYAGDAPEFNHESRTHFMRRTQTLHHAPFCDEFRWDTRFLKDPEQPSLEFTQNLGRDQE
jgi:hypothetical protein